MNWVSAAALLLLVVLPGAGPAAQDAGVAPAGGKLGEFVPAPEPYPAPSVSLADLSGKTVDLSDFRGKPVIVNLWATWCQPCRREMPSLARLQSRFGDRIAILAVSEDRGGSKVVEPFLAKLGLTSIKAYLDGKNAVGHAFDVHGLPTSLLIDRDGKVLGRVEGGAEWDSPKMLGVIEPLVAGGGTLKGQPG